jgi:beta-lactamase regulating signal transducer with metallopeptidase domain
MKRNEDRYRMRPGLLLGVLSLFFFAVLFGLLRHPETAVLLMSLPSPETFACNVRCLGLAPFLQVLGEAGKAILLIFLSVAFLYAIYRMALRIFRTLSFVEAVERKTVPSGDVPRSSFLEDVTIFEDLRPLALTAGFLKPRIFLSTKIVGALNGRELQAVVLHELHHRDSRDPLKSLAASFVSDLLFFLPISRFLRKTFSLTSEMAADAHSVDLRADPLDLAASLLKVRKIDGPAASWFFDPATERVKRLLGERSKVRRPLARVFLTAVLLAATVFVALIPVKKSISSMFIDHDKTCVLKTHRH